MAFFLDRAGTPRPSFAGSAPTRRLTVLADGQAMVETGGRWSAVAGEPLDAIADFVGESEAKPRGLPEQLGHRRALPRTVGYLSYELGAAIEGVGPAGPDPTGAPLALLATYDRADGWDPQTGRCFSIDFSNGTNSVACSASLPLGTQGPLPAGDRHGYDRGFARLKAAIAAGEIYQANLARHMSFPLEVDPATLYAQLRHRQPVPQGAYLDTGRLQLLSNSPETFLLVEAGQIRTFPIKGTRPRGDAGAEDREQLRRLTSDPKELAEHIMIVDLERNDLGRVCETGTVEVSGPAAQSFTTVHHLVSEVRGRLRPGLGLAEVLRATFPGGSITGAPKISAMQLISEVEAAGRGVYTGAIGCFNGPSAYELSIAIRTAVAVDGRIHYFAGGGIVADSKLEAEHEETVTKSRAFMDTLLETSAQGEALAN